MMSSKGVLIPFDVLLHHVFPHAFDTPQEWLNLMLVSKRTNRHIRQHQSFYLPWFVKNMMDVSPPYFHSMIKQHSSFCLDLLFSDRPYSNLNMRFNFDKLKQIFKMTFKFYSPEKIFMFNSGYLVYLNEYGTEIYNDKHSEVINQNRSPADNDCTFFGEDCSDWDVNPFVKYVLVKTKTGTYLLNLDTGKKECGSFKFISPGCYHTYRVIPSLDGCSQCGVKLLEENLNPCVYCELLMCADCAMEQVD